MTTELTKSKVELKATAAELAASSTRELRISDEVWNRVFGLPRGAMTKRKVIEMTPRLKQLAFINEAYGKITRAELDELLAVHSRNGEILIGHVGIDSGHLIIADPCHLKNWKHFESADPSKPFDHPDGDYEKLVIDREAEDGQVPKTILHGLAVVASTNGDGNMPVYATFVDGRVVSLRIEVNEPLFI